LATLDWTTADKLEHRARLHLVTELLAARAAFIVPRLPELRPGHARVTFTDGILMAVWFFRTGETLTILANLTARPLPRPQSFEQDSAVWGGEAPDELAPWSVHAAIGGA
jgi:hypothetical protein